MATVEADANWPGTQLCLPGVAVRSERREIVCPTFALGWVSPAAPLSRCRAIPNGLNRRNCVAGHITIAATVSRVTGLAINRVYAHFCNFHS
jgi:hypothetical protein